MNTKNIELEDRVHAAQVRAAYANTAPAMSVKALAALLIAGILASTGAVGWPIAIAFSVFMLVQIQARLLLIAAYHRQDPPDHEWRVWSRRFAAGATIAGFGLGLFSWLLLAPNRVDMQLLLMVYLCAVAGGAITAFGVLRPAIYFCTLPMLLVPAAWMMMRNDWLHWILTILIIGWLLAITHHARRHAARFEASVRLRYEDEELNERQRSEKSLAGGASCTPR